MRTNVQMKIELNLSLSELETLCSVTCGATSFSREEFAKRFGDKANKSVNECICIELRKLLRNYYDAANVLSR